MTNQASAQSAPPKLARLGLDAILLALLVIALLQITGLAEQAALPTLVQDVLRHPLLGKMLPAAGLAAMGEIGPRPGDPIGLLLNALTVGLLLVYLIVDIGLAGVWSNRVKAVILAAILVTAVALPTVQLMLLRQGSGPASYTHDGGVIQTEAAIQYVLAGKNPYVEDYVSTPMADWGISRYRTALYHYPYLPLTFLLSAPFYAAGAGMGFYDQRIVYLLLWALMLLAATRLATGGRLKLALVALLGLNPMMALDVIFGQNDVFVLAWLVFSLAAWRLWSTAVEGSLTRRFGIVLSAVFFGLACASKPTAWFMAPFYALLLISDHFGNAQRWRELTPWLPLLVRRLAPAMIVFVLFLLPYILWNPSAIYDDVWRWSSGQGDTGYQIWGWGGSNFVLAFGWVQDRFGQWPFWMTELLVATPLLFWFLHRQRLHNTLASTCWHAAILMLGFFYASRFLNENYLGFILAIFAMAFITSQEEALEK